MDPFDPETAIVVKNPTGRFHEVYKTTLFSNWDYPEGRENRFSFKENVEGQKMVMAYTPGEARERQYPLLLKKYRLDTGVGFKFFLEHEDSQFNFYLFYFSYSQNMKFSIMLNGMIVTANMAGNKESLARKPFRFKVTL